MNDDDDIGGGTVVLNPGPAPGSALPPSADARYPAQPQPNRARTALIHAAALPPPPPIEDETTNDLERPPQTESFGEPQPMPTQVLPVMDLPGMPGGLPMSAQAQSPSFRPGQTLPLPQSSPPDAMDPMGPRPGSGPMLPRSPAGQSTPPMPPQPRPPSQPSLPSPWPDASGPPQGTRREGERAARAPHPLMDAPTELSTRRHGNRTAFLVGGGFLLVMVLGIGGTVVVLRNQRAASVATSEPNAPTDPTAENTPSTDVATATPTPTVTSTPPPRATEPPTVAIQTGSAVSVPETAAPPATPEAEALAALEKLRVQLESCTKNGTHVLPGTSPPVPSSFAKLKKGPYTPEARDFSSSFFSCTELRFEKPMSFLIQWQLDEPSWRGVGVVWVDTDADGEIDKAHSFYAQLKKRDEVQLGPIEPMDPTKRSPIPR